MRFVSLAQESIIDISIFGATPFFQKFFQQPISGGWLDLQVHPDTSISLSNSAGHIRLSLGECLSGGEGAGPSPPEEPGREQGTEVCSRPLFTLVPCSRAASSAIAGAAQQAGA